MASIPTHAAVVSSGLAASLRERIIIEKPSAERDAMGLLQPVWTAFAERRASVVPEGTGSESEGMALSAMPRFRVTLRPVSGLSIDQRLKWNGRTLMIRQVNDDPRLKDRLVLRCEELRA